MRDSLRKFAWISILFLAVLAIVATVQACMPAEAGLTEATGAFTASGPFHSAQHPAFRDTCTRKYLDQCEYTCMMPGGILDLDCYENCIYSIC